MTGPAPASWPPGPTPAPSPPGPATDDDRLRRWRLILGGGDEEEAEGTGVALRGIDADRDRTLSQLYSSGKHGGIGRSAPRAARWLGDIRTYFPTTVVQVLQRDAIDRLGLHQFLLEPELLDAVVPDVELAASLVALKDAIPEASRESARTVIRAVTDQLTERLATQTRTAAAGALSRTTRTRRPRASDIDWNRTVLANLRHYQPDLRTVVPERLVGYGRRSRHVQRELVLLVDQSGSMSTSVVYASVFAAALAGVPALRTHVLVFDTEVADLTDLASDPVDLLFATQLGGGTDIAAAVAAADTKLAGPPAGGHGPIVVLITDLFEGGDPVDLVGRIERLLANGATVVVLLALDDAGAPAHNHDLAHALGRLGVACFACTPDVFPDLLAAAIDGRDLETWAADRELVTS